MFEREQLSLPALLPYLKLVKEFIAFLNCWMIMHLNLFESR